MLFFLWGMIFFGSFVDAIAGGGGLITLPAYLFTGLPPLTALACNKFSSSVGTTFSAGRFFAQGALNLRVALIAAASSFTGAYIGAEVALRIPTETLSTLLAVMLPMAAAFILLKRNYGEENRSDQLSRKKTIVLALLIGFFIGIYDGVFGPGTGTFAIMAFTSIMHFDLKTAAGNAKILNLASNYGALLKFMLSGAIIYQLAIPAALCAIAGHTLGAGFALKKGARLIRPTMLFVMALLLTKLLWDTFNR